MEDYGKTITSGPMTEKLKLVGRVTRINSAVDGTVNIKVKLDDQITVKHVAVSQAKLKAPIALGLDVDEIKILKRKARRRQRHG